MQAKRSSFPLFFTLFLSSIFLLSNIAASADTKAPELMSRLHCTLLLQSLKTIPLSSSILQQQISGLLGEYSSDTNNHLTYLSRMQFLPDFGFVLGGRWDSMTRDERIRFNRAFSLYIGDHYNLKSYSGSECTMNSLIYGKPHGDADNVKLPMRAISYTQLINENFRITLIYSFNYLPGEGWEMQDLSIQDRSLTAQYRIPLNALIQKGGTTHIERLIQSLSD
jgi:hypothetical protein